MRIKLKVKTNSPKNEIIEQTEDYILLNIKAVPEKGKANLEIEKFLSKQLKKKV